MNDIARRVLFNEAWKLVHDFHAVDYKKRVIEAQLPDWEKRLADKVVGLNALRLELSNDECERLDELLEDLRSKELPAVDVLVEVHA